NSYTLTLGDIVDPGTDTVSQIVVDWGDGQTTTFDAAHPLPQTRQATHPYTTAGGRSINVDLTDEDGTYLDVAVKNITVTNVPPSTPVTGTDHVAARSSYTLNLASVSNAGTVSAYKVRWGDGKDDTFSGDPSGKVANHVYADEGPFSITVDLTDENGAHNGAG